MKTCLNEQCFPNFGLFIQSSKIYSAIKVIRIRLSLKAISEKKYTFTKVRVINFAAKKTEKNLDNRQKNGERLKTKKVHFLF